MPALIAAQADFITQSAAITTTTILTTIAAGQYRLTWDAKVTTAGSVTSTLGALTVVYTDPDAVAQTITCGALVPAGTVATTVANGSTTTGNLIGVPIMLNCGAATVISIAFGYAANAANSMIYNLHVKLEAWGYN
jgi:hypothetical protein